MKAGFFGNANKPKPKPAVEPKKEEKSDIIEIKATKSIEFDGIVELLNFHSRGFKSFG